MKYESQIEYYCNTHTSGDCSSIGERHSAIRAIMNLPASEVLDDISEAMGFVSKKERAALESLIEMINSGTEAVNQKLEAEMRELADRTAAFFLRINK